MAYRLLLWDKLAVREAVINAIVHNNYNYGTPAKIELFSDHLEVTERYARVSLANDCPWKGN